MRPAPNSYITFKYIKKVEHTHRERRAKTRLAPSSISVSHILFFVSLKLTRIFLEVTEIVLMLWTLLHQLWTVYLAAKLMSEIM